MASKQIHLANHLEFPQLDGYTIRNPDGNPVGLPHNSSYSGNPGKLLTTTDVTYNVNSLAVAQRNSAKIQALIDALPDSGGWIGISNDIALTTIKLPTRTIRGLPDQPINFRLYGTRPGIQIYGMSTEPLFTLSAGPHGVVHTPTRTALCELVDLGITCRGPGIVVKDAGLYFAAHNVEVRSESGPGWHFINCYGMSLGRVGAYNGHQGVGFLFDSCIHISFAHLWSRGNRIGVQVRNSSHRSGNFFGTWDCEGNYDWQCDLDGLQKSSIGLYMESAKRMKLANCENLQFTGDGLRIDEADEWSRLMNPAIFETQLNRLTNLGVPRSSYLAIPVTITGDNTWSYHTVPEAAAGGHWVEIAPGFGSQSRHGEIYDIRFRVRGTNPTHNYLGWVEVNQNTQSIVIPATANWAEYTLERMTVGADNARIFWKGESDSRIDFELVHIAEVGRRTNYCAS